MVNKLLRNGLNLQSLKKSNFTYEKAPGVEGQNVYFGGKHLCFAVDAEWHNTDINTKPMLQSYFARRGRGPGGPLAPR